MPSTTFRFSWLPGTITQVLVRHAQQRKVLHIDRVVALFGRPALDGLYLRGQYALSAVDAPSFASL